MAASSAVVVADNYSLPISNPTQPRQQTIMSAFIGKLWRVFMHNSIAPSCLTFATI